MIKIDCMSLFLYQISSYIVRKGHPKPKSGTRKFMKRCVNKHIRIQAKDVSEDSLHSKRKYFKFEY